MIKPEVSLHLLPSSSLLSLILKLHRKHLGAPLTYGFQEKKGLALLVDTEKPEVSQHPACQTKLVCIIHKQAEIVEAYVEMNEEKLVLTDFYSSRSKYIKKVLSVQVVGITPLSPLCLGMEKVSRK